MRRTPTTRILTGGALIPMALVLAVAAGAATKPRAVLVEQADAICHQHDLQRGKNPNPPSFQDAAKATPAQLKAAAPYMARDVAITKDELHRVFALGTPAEPAARASWTKLRTMLWTELIPPFDQAIAAMKRGDKPATVRAFARVFAAEPAETRLENALGFKDCGRG